MIKWEQSEQQRLFCETEAFEVLYGGGAGAEDAVSGVCDFLENSIDDILGGGAAAEIFGAREMTVIPLTDLLVYIVENN